MEHAGILGRGWAFPVVFDKDEGAVMVEDAQDIHESLQILLSTQPGERLLRPNYGCDLQSFVFENISGDLIAKLTTQITDSILRYEKRIQLSAVEIGQDPNERDCLQIHVCYRLHGSENLYQLTTQLDTRGRSGVVFP